MFKIVHPSFLPKVAYFSEYCKYPNGLFVCLFVCFLVIYFAKILLHTLFHWKFSIFKYIGKICAHNLLLWVTFYFDLLYLK